MENAADIFAELGRCLENFGVDANSRRAAVRAVADNPWFTSRSVVMAVDAIRTRMLDKQVLEEWLSSYTLPPPHSRKLNIIMAGNIPLVGFADLMYGLVCGYDCYIKPSSKDRELIVHIAGLLGGISSGVRITEGLCDAPDALIATGSDNTVRLLQSRYPGVRSLFRGSRSSAAVLSGSESEEDLRGLSEDIFSYCGLGCRNVSMLLLPEGYDVRSLAETLSRYAFEHPKYRNNYLQNKALLQMQGEEFVDGGFFTLVPSGDFPLYISRISYAFYKEWPGDWISGHTRELQCVVGGFPGAVPFGAAQYPRPWDYADGTDVVRFLGFF